MNCSGLSPKCCRARSIGSGSTQGSTVTAHMRAGSAGSVVNFVRLLVGDRGPAGAVAGRIRAAGGSCSGCQA